MNRSRLWLAAALLVLLPGSATAGISYRGWGPRAGVSVDPDQVVGGIHVDLGEIIRNLRFQPNVDLGVGDDAIFVGANLAALWFFPADGSWDPYAGGELGFLYQDVDVDRGEDDTDLDVTFNAVGGVETRLKSNNRFLIELKVGIVEDPDVKLMVGWTF